MVERTVVERTVVDRAHQTRPVHAPTTTEHRADAACADVVPRALQGAATERELQRARLANPDDAMLDALLLRRSRARGRGGGASTRLIDNVESKWTVLY